MRETNENKEPGAVGSDSNGGLGAILPCPFCGKPGVFGDPNHDVVGLDVPGVECKNERCCRPRNFAASNAEALLAWNRRAFLENRLAAERDHYRYALETIVGTTDGSDCQEVAREALKDA